MAELSSGGGGYGYGGRGTEYEYYDSIVGGVGGNVGGEDGEKSGENHQDVEQNRVCGQRPVIGGLTSAPTPTPRKKNASTERI